MGDLKFLRRLKGALNLKCDTERKGPHESVKVSTTEQIRVANDCYLSAAKAQHPSDGSKH